MLKKKIPSYISTSNMYSANLEAYSSILAELVPTNIQIGQIRTFVKNWHNVY